MIEQGFGYKSKNYRFNMAKGSTRDMRQPTIILRTTLKLDLNIKQRINMIKNVKDLLEPFLGLYCH